MSSTTETTSAERSPSPRPASRGGIPFGYIVAAIVVIGIGVLIVATVSGGRYELVVGQVATAPDSFDGKSLRVRGQIKEGSISSGLDNGQPVTRFTLVDENGHELKVVTRESPPNNFEGGKMCIVEGRYDGAAGTVESTRLTMKCPSKYEAEGNGPKSSDDLYERYRKAPSESAPGAPRS